MPNTMTVADLMTPAPRTCSPFSSVLEATLIFRDADCGAVPITDDGRPVGILTDRDVALAVAEYPDLARRAVGDLMTQGVATIPATASLVELEAAFREHGVRRLLVVEGDALVGIVSQGDLGRVLQLTGE